MGVAQLAIDHCNCWLHRYGYANDIGLCSLDLAIDNSGTISLRPGVFWLIGPHVALVVMVLYLLLLFGIAQYADHQKHLGRSIVANPYVYALSLCVYVSAWTFYGSIGKAASTGLEFLPIYLGPVLAMTIGWIVIRKMIRVSKEFGLTSVSDFISFRYGSSYTIGAVVAVLSLIMVTPYVALQLIAISTSLDILSGPQLLLGFSVESKLLVALLLGAFAVIFGASHLDPMERHEGLIAVVAFESLVKIVAFLLVGIYVAYGVFGGYGNIMEEMTGLASGSEAYADLMDVEYPLWFSLTLISFFAVFFLPRQFHVMVVENSDEMHLKKAMWLFPLYLLLINIFVPAIAGGGLLLNTPGLKDAFIITIPYAQGQDWLASVRLHRRNIRRHGHDSCRIRSCGNHAAQRPGDALYFKPYKEGKKPGKYASQCKKAKYSPGCILRISLFARRGLSDPSRYWNCIFPGSQSVGTRCLRRTILEEGQPRGGHGRPDIWLLTLGLYGPHSNCGGRR